MYIVFEGGGVEFEPKIHGVFYVKEDAQKCIKNAMVDFLKEFDPSPEIWSEDSRCIVEREQKFDRTLFYIYQDEEEKTYNAFVNVFVLAEVKNK